MSERDEALRRDAQARDRLNDDPVFQIKRRRLSGKSQPNHQVSIARSLMRNPEPSARELEILACLSRGLTSPMTADALGMALETVKSHVVNVRPKLRAKNATEACCEAIRRGLIP